MSTVAVHPFPVNRDAVAACFDRHPSILTHDAVTWPDEQPGAYRGRFHRPELIRLATSTSASPATNAVAGPRATSRLGTWTMSSARRDRPPPGPPTGLTRRRRGVGAGGRRPAPLTRYGAPGASYAPPHQLPGQAATIWTREQHRSADTGEAHFEVGEADQLGTLEPPR